MKNLLINRPIVSLIEPPLNIFFRLFCFPTKDLYNDGAIDVDGSVCRTLCDLCIRLDGSPGCEDSPIAIMQKNKLTYIILYIIKRTNELGIKIYLFFFCLS